jgi:uncharacterized membrane protein YkvI
MRAGMKWMFLIFGTTIGAGYASGRELWQFFGHESGLAILLFAAFFSLSCIIIMKVSYRKKTNHYLPVLQEIVGIKLAKIYDVIIFFYLYTTTVTMIAGSGATGQAFNFSYWLGIVIIVIALILLFTRGINGLLYINQLILPLLITGLLYVLLLFIFNEQLFLFSHWHEQRNWIAAFPFTALNILPLIAVVGAIGTRIKSSKEIYISSIGSGVILGAVSYIYNSSLIQIADEMLLYEIPLFAILKNYPFQTVIFMAVMLWLAIFTTAATGLLGLASRLKVFFQRPLWLIVVIILITMLPLSFFGFSNLINYLYPLYGMLNLYVLTRLLLFPLWYKRKSI